MKKRIIAKKLITAFCFYALIAIAIILMPILSKFPDKTEKIVRAGVGIMFWVGLLGGSITYLRLYRKCKKIIDGSNKRKIPSGLMFFSNRAAKVVDALFLLSIILNLLFLKFINVGFFLAWLALFLFVTSLYFHFLFNSRLFNYILSK